ncbi:MAG TPA: hypothetical protein VFV99_23945 [Kofleriaceae bacterium]|nr:hypothetical protein [Kofleriaceae bacterium]
MHKVNAGLTVLVRLKTDCVDAASALLVELDAHQERLPFAKSATTHFATITVIPAQKYGDKPLPAMLLFATSFCGPTRVHVSELVRIMGDGLREVLQHCERFEPSCSDDELEDFLIYHRHGDTFYSGMQGLSPADVQQHRQLREAIEEFIDDREAHGGFNGSPLVVRNEIQKFVLSRPDLAWAEQPVEESTRAWLVFHWRSLIIEAFLAALIFCTGAWFGGSSLFGVIAACGWIAVLAFVVFVAVMWLSIFEAEHDQTYVAARTPDDRARFLAATQTRPVINEFTLAGPIKEEGMLRPAFVKVSLWVIARVVEGVPWMPYVGSGINIPTVATARWIAADGGRRLMFISNYTNEGIAYVRDFIETRGGAMRINLSFGFGRGFPKTRWLLWDGALTDPNAYLYALSEHQRRTLFWYGPYRDISIDNIKRNRQIREGLFADYNEDQAKKWLQLL